MPAFRRRRSPDERHGGASGLMTMSTTSAASNVVLTRATRINWDSKQRTTVARRSRLNQIDPRTLEGLTQFLTQSLDARPQIADTRRHVLVNHRVDRGFEGYVTEF